MNNWYLWAILNQLVGNPLLAFLLLIVGGWAMDQAVLGFLPSPLRIFRRWQRTQHLESELGINPHDRRARFELADILIDQRRFDAARTWLERNVAAGDDDVATLYLLGVACYQSRHFDDAEKYLARAAERDGGYRFGAVYLETGRGRLQNNDPQGARAALEAFCEIRKGTVEGRVLLAQALEATGDTMRANAMRDEAWHEYVTAPRFAQRQERLWAWRLRPWRPAIMVLLSLGVIALLAWKFPKPADLSRAFGTRTHQVVPRGDETE